MKMGEGGGCFSHAEGGHNQLRGSFSHAEGGGVQKGEVKSFTMS